MKTNNKKYFARGSDKNHVTWIEDASGKRICTMKQSENDWSMCKLIELSLNNHDDLVGALKKVVSTDAEKMPRLREDIEQLLNQLNESK